ncbi:MAG: hypothetical protein ACD_75C01015G0002 [uncultured bacterium]|nr:MAG: hypothetical protein ACD_75C01015G0002 [uncultured bacterium]
MSEHVTYPCDIGKEYIQKKHLKLFRSKCLNLQWLGDEGSNLDKRSQSPPPYH